MVGAAGNETVAAGLIGGSDASLGGVIRLGSQNVFPHPVEAYRSIPPCRRVALGVR